MSHSTPTPLLNVRFRVEIEGLQGTGAVEVVFPEARVGARTRHGRRTSYGSLFLKRGVDRSHEWYAWWHDARNVRTARSRTVTVTLLDESGAAARRWAFRDSRPLAYSLSNLNALGHEVLIETLELAVGGFEADVGSSEARPRRSKA